MNSSFEFIRVDSFMDDINRENCFDTMDMDGVSPNYQVLLVSDCASDISDCIDADGTLVTPYDTTTKKGVTIIETLEEDDGYCSMMWSKGINGERTMSVSDSTVSYNFGDDIPSIRGLFLVNIANGTGYVIAYCILDKAIKPNNNSMICPCDGLVWSFKYGE